MRATEFIVEGVSEGLLEAREGTMREIIRKTLPTWPEYVIKDWISSRVKNQEDLKNLTGWLVDLNKMVEPNSWKLHQKMFLTFDMLNPRTRYSMKTKRQFGARNPFLIPRDEERNANAEQLVKTKGMENLPPVTMIQHSNGLELCEGWHRTMAAFRLHPEGFYVNAWIGQAGQQGIAEGLEHADKLSGLVDLPVFPSSTNPRGTAKVVNTGDRIMAVLNVRGVNIPYYISTGGGGKASVPTGKWYPIFGRHSSGWLNKGGEDSINKSYGSNVLALGSSRLNNMLGDLSSMESQIPFMKKSGDAIINRDLQPMSYSEVSANPDEFKKRVNSFLAKLGSPPFYKVNATETQGVAEGKLIESAVFLNPTTVIVGQAHGQPLELSPNTLKQIQAIAAKHGAYYEGNGTDRAYTKGQIDRYVGSWDDEVAKTASPNDPKWLYVLFANVDANNRVQRVGVDPKDTIFNRLLATAKDNSFQSIGYTSQALQKFLQMSSEGKYDFVKMSQQPATQENLTRFLKAGEALMWPNNWEQYPNKAGKIAKAATVDVRDQYLATRKAGVYVTGSGHLKAVQNITGKQGVAEDN